MIIYALKDPRTDEIRYIGKTTKSVDWRLRRHLEKSELRHDTHKTHWLRQLVAAGLKPDAEVIMTCDSEEELSQAEIFCIGFARDIGLPLTNATEGGDGCVATVEVRQKISTAQKGRSRWTAEQCQEMSLKRRGRSNLTLEQQAKAAAARVGKHPTDEARANMSRAQQGRCKSAEHRAKLSQSLKGKPWSKARRHAQEHRDVSTQEPQGMWDKVG